jgi:hypothetical protein
MEVYMTFEKAIKILKEKTIYSINCFRYVVMDRYFTLHLSIGNPELKIDLRRKSGDHNYKQFKKYLINQEYYVTNINSEIAVRILGFWVLKYNEEILFDSKIGEENSEKLFNFLFQGHKIDNIKYDKEKIIRIYFSNGMEINIIENEQCEGLLMFSYDNDVLGICNNDGIIEKEDTIEKFEIYLGKRIEL